MSIFRVIRSPSRIKDLCLIICSLSIFYLLLHHSPQTPPPQFFLETTTTTATPTSLRHLLFCIASSSLSLRNRKPYLRLWYNPNTTRAVVFLDNPPFPPNPPDPSLPPTAISADTSSFPYTYPRGLRSAIRVARIVKEAVLLNETDVRWFVFCDDDTVFVKENLVRTLSKYDHDQWYYVGSGSESYEQSLKNSFDMAFGGGGFAISCSLARVLARVLDSCLMRYPDLYGSDGRIYSCLAELGVGLTREPGFHQVDVRGDIFGMLSAHPLTPLVSLHHFDFLEPIFPNMTKPRALKHLFKAVNADPIRVLQQTVCYDQSKSLTISVAWGYAVQVFEGNHLLPDLLQPQKTFTPWSRRKSLLGSLYTFNTREYLRYPCKRPIVFFMESVASESNKVWSNYIRYEVANCSRTRTLRDLQEIRVLSQKLDLGRGEVKAMRRQCCDVMPSSSRSMGINIRQCRTGELIAMQT